MVSNEAEPVESVESVESVEPDASVESDEPEDRGGVRVPLWSVIAVVLTCGTGLHVYAHHMAHGSVSAVMVALAFFLVLGVFINYWELALVFHEGKIQREYLAAREAYGDRPLVGVGKTLLQTIPLRQVLWLRHWSIVWGRYSLFDTSYTDRRSYGYNIDVGNGFSTIVPSIVFALGLTYEFIPARILGILGIAMFWQMFYGTVIYLFQFFHCGRHRGHHPGHILGFVVGTNGVWLAGPALGMWASVDLILSGSFAIFA